jgi:hypothetical protein
MGKLADNVIRALPFPTNRSRSGLTMRNTFPLFAPDSCTLSRELPQMNASVAISIKTTTAVSAL